MPDNFDTIVIGKGMMGSAAARHLALSGASVALIGPDEPANKSTHTGVFASHYDQGRITRALDTNPDWSRLAIRSIARYDDIARTGGVRFFHRTGALQAGCTAYADALEKTGIHHGADFDRCTDTGLKSQFPFFAFPDNTRAMFEPDAGYINPRALVEAQTNAAKNSGATIIHEQAANISEHPNHVVVTLIGGQQCTADKVIVAAGAFANQLLPVPVRLRLNPRTVVLFELDTAEAARLSNMPSLIHTPFADDDGPYLLPPIKYPDGKTYLKIGGDPRDDSLTTPDEITDWFQSDGLPSGRDYLIEVINALMPELRFTDIKTAPCVTTLTPTGMPVIEHQSRRIIALTGGNGAAAKSSDEIGRLGAVLAQKGDLSDEGYTTRFSAT